jgi:hypothetical protein
MVHAYQAKSISLTAICSKLLAAEKVFILLDIACPLFGNFTIWEDSFYWTLILACTTIYALIWIDIILVVTLINTI